MNDRAASPNTDQSADADLSADDAAMEPASQPPTLRGPLFAIAALVVCGLLVLVVMIASRPKDSARFRESLAVGEPAPRIELVRLSDDLSLEPYSWQPGKVTLLHFWGTWCGPCRLEYPELSQMAEQFQSDDRFQFLPVSCAAGRGEMIEDLWNQTEEYLTSNLLDRLAFADPQGITRRSAAERMQQYEIYYPTSILIDHEGSIAGIWEGYAPESVGQIADITGQLIAACPR